MPNIAQTTTSSIAQAIRITVRDTKGNATTHVRISLSHVPAPSSPTSHDDAIAALTILASDLDSFLAPEHEWHSEAHRRHALSQLLEQIVEAVMDVRLASVRRVEHALKRKKRSVLNISSLEILRLRSHSFLLLLPPL